MAFRSLLKRFSRLPKVGKLQDGASKRALVTSAEQMQEKQNDAVQIDRKQGRQRPSALANAWPSRTMLPGLFSPFFGPSPSLTQMLDTVDRVFNAPMVSDTSRMFSDVFNDRIPWDVMEDDKCFKLRVDMPGYTKEEVKLTVEEDELILKAEHKTAEEEEDWSSRSYGSYNLRIRLPDNVDTAGIKAELKDGVLKVKAPKVEVKKESLQVQVD